MNVNVLGGLKSHCVTGNTYSINKVVVVQLVIINMFPSKHQAKLPA